MKTKFIALCTAFALTMSLGAVNLNAQTPKSAKPFLIQGKLPHLTGMVKILWDDEDLALSEAQKEKLIVVRKNTMKQAKALGQKVNKLEASIVKASLNGVKPEDLKEDMYKLAKLRADASMVHLVCIYETRNILSKDQLEILE